MSLESDIAFFEGVPTFSVLGKQALRILAIGAEAKQLQSGAVLFYAGHPADAGYIVQEGSLLLEPGTPSEGKEIIVGRGTLVGELALLTEMVSPATATANETTVVIRISRSLFRKMLESYPAAAVQLRDIMAGRLNSWERELRIVRSAMDKKS
ncbi:MAG: Crp/Fnr family transcriptional regulator [Pseudolabrys sp.]|nr:Crp/Fnr family transcriptional regulator [Pseudolabrys sp.]MSP32128.1 Crp/Fnr family transcriptional regulator [Pseudolabrys sp.]